MTDPIHPILAGAVLGASLSLTGTVLGAQTDALVLGLMAAALVSAWLQKIDSVGSATAAICLSAMLSGHGSPLAAELLSTLAGGPTNGESLRLFCAVVIGAASPSLVPLLLTRAKKVARGPE